VPRPARLRLQPRQRHPARRAGSEHGRPLPRAARPARARRARPVRGRTLRVMAMTDVARELLQKYATAAPRYTSYPTAVDWSKDFDPARTPELLARGGQQPGPLSVYVHLPFCAELCLFCGCNMVVSSSLTRIDSYLDALELEFEF